MGFSAKHSILRRFNKLTCKRKTFLIFVWALKLYEGLYLMKIILLLSPSKNKLCLLLGSDNNSFILRVGFYINHMYTIVLH